MSRHFWQQTQKYITKTSGENIAIKVLGKNSKMWHFCRNLGSLTNDKNDILVAKSFGA